MASITLKNPKEWTQAKSVAILRRCANDLAVVQKEQIAAAFRNGGQPGAKWKPLWADKFVGNMSAEKTAALSKATMAYLKFLGSKKPVTPSQIAKKSETFNKATAKATGATSYRKGGQPLRDTGALGASFFNKYNFVFEQELSLLVVIASSNLTAKWHQEGFKTKGPNFIPLTLKAAREHVKGANPKDEGMEYGVDYIMAWKGVKIPSRPMIDYEDAANKAQINETISLAMKG